MSGPGVQMCEVSDLVPTEPECLRVAQWEWHPQQDDHPVHLCNFHADPLITPAAIEPKTGKIPAGIQEKQLAAYRRMP